MTILEVIAAAGNIATASGIVIAANQLFQTKRQARTAFEDDLVKQYREIVARIPYVVLLGADDEPDDAVKDAIFRYVDLCNTQVFLRQNGRIDKETWDDWCKGIQATLNLPVFKKVWEEIKEAESLAGCFQELRKLEKDFNRDPKSF